MAYGLKYAKLGLLDKSRTIKGFVVCNRWNESAFRPAKRSSHTFLSTIPKGINQYGLKHAQFGLIDKSRTIKGFVVCNRWNDSAFGTAKRSDLTFLLIVPKGIISMTYKPTSLRVFFLIKSSHKCIFYSKTLLWVYL